VASDDLTLDVSSRWRSFPAKGAKLPQILAGVSGSFAIAGDIHAKASVPIHLVPGMPISGTGRLDATIRLKDGTVRPDSSYSFESEDLRVGLLGLTAVGSATVAGTTHAGDNGPRTELAIDLASFEFLGAENASIGVEGSGLAVRAAWDDLSLAEWKPATTVEVEVPPAQIRDISIIDRLLPPQLNLAVESGTGTLSGRVAVDADRKASGQLDLESKELRVRVRDVPIRADLGVHATLTQGDLPEHRFEISEATITVDNAVNEGLEQKEQEKRGLWWCSLKLTQGTVTFGRPLAASGAMAVKMRDTRPVVTVIKELSKPPKWMSLLPEIENVDGTMIVDMDGATTAVDDVDITGESLQILGWLHLAEKKANGRIYVKYKGFAAGIGLDEGKSSVHLAKPRQWFDEQTASTP
jgi:hypothetical protein